MIKSLYGRALEKFDKYEMAGELFEQAALQVDDEKEIGCLARAALAYERSGVSSKTLAILRKMRAKAETDNKKTKRLYKALQELAELKKDSYLSIAALEGQIDQSPAAFRTRFALAYAHSEVGNEDVALHHYLQISSNERLEMDWNNLGAAYNHFNINARTVAAYRKSEAMGETLAMSNLGFKLLQAGFVDEAQSICAKALEIEGFHGNIGQLSAAIRDNPEKETKSVTAILDGAKPRIRAVSA